MTAKISKSTQTGTPSREGGLGSTRGWEGIGSSGEGDLAVGDKGVFTKGILAAYPYGGIVGKEGRVHPVNRSCWEVHKEEGESFPTQQRGEGVVVVEGGVQVTYPA